MLNLLSRGEKRSTHFASSGVIFGHHEDVARLAGVSTSTVSHVINNNRFVSDTIREKVMKAVEDLNYAPSALARSLKINQTRTIGMLLTASSNPFYAEVVRGVERCCYERGYSLILCNTEGDRDRMSHSLETLLQKRVDGVLLMCTESHRPLPEMMSRYPSVPMVMMDWAPLKALLMLLKITLCSVERLRPITSFLVGIKDSLHCGAER